MAEKRLEMSYRREIDGLRSIAIIPVVLYHLGAEFVPGGYLGVDVFFVISGFLITSLLMRDLRNGDFSITAFWGRRVRRIMPALLGVVVGSTVIFHLFLFQHDLIPHGGQRVAALLAVANLYFWRHTGSYWDSASEASPFLHFWSLSVEEQYYLFFPVLLWLLYRSNRRWVAPVLAFGTVGSLGWFVFGVEHAPVATFYLLPTRAWELGAGCLLALVPLRRFSDHTGVNGLGTVGGLGLIGLAYFSASEHLEIGYGAIAAVAGTALVILAGSNRVSGWGLENPIAVYVGRISYSLYLWHWPVISFFRMRGEQGDQAVPALIQVACFVGLSVMSYHAIETPLRRRPRATRSLLAAYGVAILLALAVRDYRHDYVGGKLVPAAWHGWEHDLSPSAEIAGALETLIAGLDAPRRTGEPDAYLRGGDIVAGATATPDVVVLGDSHMLNWTGMLTALADETHVTTAFLTMSGVSPFFDIPVRKGQAVRFLNADQKEAFDRSRLLHIDQWRPRVVIIGTRWDLVRAEQAKAFLDWLRERCDRILLVESPPTVPGVGNRNLAQYLSFRSVQPNSGGRTYYGEPDTAVIERTRSLMRDLAVVESIEWIPIADLFMAETGVWVYDGANVLYLDDDHLTEYGAQLARDRWRRAWRAALGLD